LGTTSILTAGTSTIDINVSDVISRIGIILELVNDGNNPTNHPLAAIPKVEIVDGSKVVGSMTGYGAQAMSYYGTGKMPHNELNFEDNGYARCFIPLDFGRWLYDEMFALDPKQFKNLQLRITHDYTLGGCSPDGATLRVVADMFDQKSASPQGYLLNKEIFSFTPAAGTEEPILLPLDNTIRKLIIMNVNDNEEPDIQFEDVLLSEEDGKRTVFEGKTMDLIRSASMKFGRFTEYLSGHLATTTDDEFWLSACKDIQVGGLCDLNDAVLTFTWSGGRARTFYASAATYFGAIVSGRCPHGAVPMFFGMQDEPDDWWNVSNVGKVKLSLTPRTSGGGGCDTEKTTDVIVQSVESY
jgi:hypothetical protein